MGKTSYCMRHSSRVASGRCKQCHKPLCGECAMSYPEDGVFCSDKCHTMYDRFASRAKSMPMYRGGLAIRLHNLLMSLIGLVKLAVVLGVLVGLLLFTGNKYHVGLKIVQGKTPIPIEIVLPQGSAGQTGK